MLPKILLLDDCSGRATWLKDNLRGEAHVLWVHRVRDFQDYLDRYRGELAAIVLDHDIPPPDDTPDNVVILPTHGLCDVDGKTGYDAALSLHVGEEIPVLIWSLNAVGGARMYQVLREKNIKGYRLSYYPGHFDMIEGLMRDFLHEFRTRSRDDK